MRFEDVRLYGVSKDSARYEYLKEDKDDYLFRVVLLLLPEPPPTWWMALRSALEERPIPGGRMPLGLLGPKSGKPELQLQDPSHLKGAVSRIEEAIQEANKAHRLAFADAIGKQVAWETAIAVLGDMKWAPAAPSAGGMSTIA